MRDLSNENVIHVKKNGIEFLQFKKLLEYSDIINHAYSLGINSNFRTDNINHTITEEQRRKAINNYKNLAIAIDSEYTQIIKPHQMHTNEIKYIEDGQNEFELNSKWLENTDGLITNKSKIMLATTNADCILLLFFDPVKKVIGNIHSGWRGTLQRISVDAVRKMQLKYGSRVEDIICCMCPSIRKMSF